MGRVSGPFFFCPSLVSAPRSRPEDLSGGQGQQGAVTKRPSPHGGLRVVPCAAPAASDPAKRGLSRSREANGSAHAVRENMSTASRLDLPHPSGFRCLVWVTDSLTLRAARAAIAFGRPSPGGRVIARPPWMTHGSRAVAACAIGQSMCSARGREGTTRARSAAQGPRATGPRIAATTDVAGVPCMHSR